MKIKDSDIYKKYLEYSSNPQAKAFLSLCFWLLFFLVVVLFVRFSSKPSLRSQTSYKSGEINSYEYTYSDEKNIIYGKTYNGKHIFNNLNGKFYYDGKNVYEIKNHKAFMADNNVIKYLKISPQMINNLTDNLNYNVLGSTLIYKVPLSNFLNLFDNDVPINLDVISNNYVIINKCYKGDLLYMVEIDLSDYYLYKNEENRGILTIEFYEQNKINNFTSEYDRMIGVIR